MRYRLIKHNITCKRTISTYETLNDAKRQLAKMQLSFKELSYFGGFPVYEDDNGIEYSIVGYADIGIVCKLSGEAIAELRN